MVSDVNVCVLCIYYPRVWEEGGFGDSGMEKKRQNKVECAHNPFLSHLLFSLRLDSVAISVRASALGPRFYLLISYLLILYWSIAD